MTKREKDILYRAELDVDHQAVCELVRELRSTIAHAKSEKNIHTIEVTVRE